MMKKDVRCLIGIFMAVAMLCGLNGCSDVNNYGDDWYIKGNIYTDDKGNRLEVFFNDYGTLEFAVNGLSLYFTTVDNFQQENNWKVYTCDDDTMIIYYPGNLRILRFAMVITLGFMKPAVKDKYRIS